MIRRVFKVISILILIMLVFPSLSHFIPSASASSHPRNYTEAWNAGFRGIIEPQNPVVLQQLHTICPTIDEEHFTGNFLAVYTYSMLIPYAYDSDVYGTGDYWQTSEETITIGHGDCEDQAINLASLIDALYEETYGYIPSNLVWVVLGNVVTIGGGGGHGWVLVNEGCLPKETVEEIKTTSISELLINIVLGGIAYASDLITEIETKLDLATLPSRNTQQSFSLFYSGERYFELEPTWNLPVSEFYYKKYPYTSIWTIFNSQGYDSSPDFYTNEQPPYMGAEIKNIAFPLWVVVGDMCTVNVTVQNYDCGILGADLVVVLKDYGIEVARQSAYVFKYWWQIHTFVFTLQAIEPAQTERMSAELYWNNWGTWLLRDFKNFTIETISNKPDLMPTTLSIYPQNPCEGQLVVLNIFGQNRGPISANSWLTDIFIDGQLFDRISVTNCVAFSGFQIQTKPWKAAAGMHSLRVVVDATNSVLEHNETNNQMILPLLVRVNKGSYVHVQVSSSSDDTQKWNNTSGGCWQWNLTYSMNVAGCPYVFGSPLTGGEDNFGCGLRFTNMTIPQKAKITYARLELCASWDDESPVRTKIHGENTASSLTFSTLADFNTRNWTSTFVYWDDIPAWKTNEWYFSPDISKIIQEIVDRPDWKSGNSMAMMWEDFESRSISYIENSRRAWSYDANPTLAPRLLIDYEDIFYPEVFVYPESVVAKAGQNITVTVAVSNLTDSVYTTNGEWNIGEPLPPYDPNGTHIYPMGYLVGFDIHFAWDPNVLEYLNRTVTVPFESYPTPIPPLNFTGTLHQPIQPIKDNVDATLGTYWLAKSTVGTNYFLGNGTLFQMTFRVKKEGGSPLKLSNCELAAPLAQFIGKTYNTMVIPCGVRNGSVSVSYEPDVAVVSVKPSKTVVGLGCDLIMNITVTNKGDYAETFNVTLYANTTAITTQPVTLASENSTTTTFTWNTIGFAKGNYTIWAYAWPLRDETDVSDNSCTGGWIVVTIPGDVVEPYFEVDIYDITAICVCYDSKIGDHMYYPNCDLDGNGIIDIFDVTAACVTYGQKYP